MGRLGSNDLELARLIRDCLELTISQAAKSSTQVMSGNLSGRLSLGPRSAGYCGIDLWFGVPRSASPAVTRQVA